MREGEKVIAGKRLGQTRERKPPSPSGHTMDRRDLGRGAPANEPISEN